MSESLNIPQGSKADIYEALLPQIEADISAETDPIANLANVAACLQEAFHFWWVGFYRVLPLSSRVNDDVPSRANDAVSSRANDADPSAATPGNSSILVLGPFQGPLACTRIRYGRGVCGTAWKEARTLIVPDVDQFPGHIACSSASRSEIVVPIFRPAPAASRASAPASSGTSARAASRASAPAASGTFAPDASRASAPASSGTSAPEVIAVLDIDSEHLATFDEVDQHYLEQLSTLLSIKL